MSESERKQIITEILTFPANTYSREYLDGPHPRTGKPYSNAELKTFLNELQQAAGKSARKTQPQVQQSPEEARIQAQQVWEYFFSHHLEIADNTANRKALFERGLSLSDDEMVRPAHLDEAAKLLIAEGTIKTKTVLTAAELKQQAVKDLETFKQAAIQLGFAANMANENLVRQVLGLNYSISDIAQAIASNALKLAPVGETEQQQRDEQERQNILEEIIGARIITHQDRLKFESMPLEQLRAEVVRIREERKLRQMTGSELRAHLRQQRSTTPEPNDLDDMSRDNILLSMQAAGQDRVTATGREDTRASGEADYLRALCQKVGWKAVEQKMGRTEPRIGGFVRTLKHEFDNLETA